MNVGDLLVARQPFIVPPYQRGYAWEDSELDDFIRDIRKLLDARRIQSEARHFFGGVFTVAKEDPEASPGRRFDIIDGQQRLATFTLMLSLIAFGFDSVAAEAAASREEELAETARSLAEQTRNEFLETFGFRDGRRIGTKRLILSRADRVHFQQLQEGFVPEPERASHERLNRAWEKLRNELVDEVLRDAEGPLTAQQKIERLHELRDTVTEGCFVLHITSSSEHEARRLFMVINDRGRNLGAGDLLRAWTLEQSEGQPQVQDELEKLWDEILADEESHIEHFLRARFASYVGRRAGRGTLFDEFRDRFFLPEPLAPHDSFLVETLSLRDDAALFRKLINGEWVYRSDTSVVRPWQKSRLRLLLARNALDHTLSLPLLLAAARHLPESVFAEMVHLLERVYFRYKIICRGHTGPLTAIYHEEALEIREVGASYQLARLEESLRELLDDRASEQTFRSEAPRQLLYRRGSNRILKYFLTTLAHYCAWDAAKSKWEILLDDSYVLDQDSLELEHIYPQNPGDVVPELEEYKHTLGNISFWRSEDNRAASNADFGEKRSSYAGSHVVLNRRLAEFSTWDADAIAMREQELIDCALRIFKV